MADHSSRDARGADAPTASMVVGTRYEGPAASPGFALWRVAAIWQREVRAALTEVELTHAQFVLLVSSAWLQAAGDQPVTQALVSAHANSDAVMTSEVLRTLERKKLVRRLPHPTDARAKEIVLTAAGKKLSRRAIALVEAVDEAFFGAPGAELQALARLICPRAKG